MPTQLWGRPDAGYAKDDVGKAGWVLEEAWALAVIVIRLDGRRPAPIRGQVVEQSKADHAAALVLGFGADTAKGR